MGKKNTYSGVDIEEWEPSLFWWESKQMLLSKMPEIHTPGFEILIYIFPPKMYGVPLRDKKE